MSHSPRRLTPYVAGLAVGSVLWASQCPDDEPTETPRPSDAPSSPPKMSPRPSNLDSLPTNFGCQAMNVVSGLDNPLSLPLDEDGGVSERYDPLDGVLDCVEHNQSLDDPVCLKRGTYLHCFDGKTVVQIHDASGDSRRIGAVPHSESRIVVGWPTFKPLELWHQGPEPLDGVEWPVSFDSPQLLTSDLSQVCADVEARFSETPPMSGKHTALIAQLMSLLEKDDDLQGDLNDSGLPLESNNGGSHFVVGSPLNPNDTWVVRVYVEGYYDDVSRGNDANTHSLSGLDSVFWLEPFVEVEDFGVNIYAGGVTASGDNWDEAVANMEWVLLDRGE